MFPLQFIGSIVAALLLGAMVLHLIPRLGAPGKKLGSAMCQAPLLDLVVTYFTILPMIAGIIAGGWQYGTWIGALFGFIYGVMAQVLSVFIWQFAHEAANVKHIRGPRIVKVINKAVGRWRNHTAVWITALAVPVFWFVRIAELVVYPPLTKLVGLPPYRHRDWVNVSRQKFKGLVGHDLIWCLYCDWMTGVWSLGSEMLRNVESFWCPIRFSSEKKCKNCAIDFPDVFGGWVPADQGMQEVADVLAEKYPPGGWKETPYSSWFGHPARLTINGQPHFFEEQASVSPSPDLPAQ